MHTIPHSGAGDSALSARIIDHALVRVIMLIRTDPCGSRAVYAIELFNADLVQTPAVAIDTAGQTAQWAGRIRAYLRGEQHRFDDIALDDARLGAFQRMVLAAARDIPCGATISYGELARRVQRPGAARAVGGALRTNPFPLLIPCHRVVRASGRPGGFGGAAEGPRAALKCRLIDHERRCFSL